MYSARLARPTQSKTIWIPGLIAIHPRKHLHPAPPFLIEDYLPRYQLLSSVDASKKRSAAYAHLRNCNLCSRLCGVNRYEKTGTCLIGTDVKISVIAPHVRQGLGSAGRLLLEPCIQGHNGSGVVFFSGCNLRCVFCQNRDIAHQRNGQDLTPEEFGECRLTLYARDLGLKVPIIYNTSAFDSLASVQLLNGLVEIYLPNFKVWNDSTSKQLLKADSYTTAKETIKAMHEQVGDLRFSPDGIAKKGLLVRHLVMPHYTTEGEEIMEWIAGNVSKDVFVNIMEQYHPDAHVGKPKHLRRSKPAPVSIGEEEVEAEAVRYEDINRPITSAELSTVRQAAEKARLWRFCDPPKH